MNRTERISPYFHRYLNLVPEGNLVHLMEQQRDEALAFFATIPEDRWTYAYAPEKWTLLQSWLHVLDSERIFTTRALRIARGDQTPQPGFDQDEFAPNSDYEHRTPADLIEEYRAVRQSSILLFRHLSPAARQRIGTFSGYDYAPETVGRILLGHERHHFALTKERYLP